MPGIAHLMSFQLAPLSPSQCPEYLPTPGNEERVKTIDRLVPKTAFDALEANTHTKLQCWHHNKNHTREVLERHDAKYGGPKNGEMTNTQAGVKWEFELNERGGVERNKSGTNQ